MTESEHVEFVNRCAALEQSAHRNNVIDVRWSDQATEVTLGARDLSAWKALFESLRPSVGDVGRLASQAVRCLSAPSLSPGDRPGVVLLKRSQKIIAIDRPNRMVYQFLRSDAADRVELLQREQEAARSIPQRTIPLLLAHTARPPYFLVQSYVPWSRPASWQSVLPHMRSIVQTLFEFYEARGFERVNRQTYQNSVLATVRASLSKLRSESLRAAVSSNLEQLVRQLDDAAPADLLLAQAHGDFISAHIVRPRERNYPDWLLVDWSESKRRSLVYDLFYFQFQNRATDLWDRLLANPVIDFRQYWGGGYDEWLEQANVREWQVTATELRQLLLLAFIETLDHRLNDLDHVHTDWWVTQARQLLKRAKQ